MCFASHDLVGESWLKLVGAQREKRRAIFSRAAFRAAPQLTERLEEATIATIICESLSF